MVVPEKHVAQITLREILEKYFDQGGGGGGDLASAFGTLLPSSDKMASCSRPHS